MANVNINRNLSDQFYRYKMPKLIAKVEGKGNGIKTVIVNMPEIAKSLNRPPMYPTKYFGCLLGAQTNFDNKTDRYIINGAHDPNKLQDLLDGFIQKYVLCQSCENPETILSVNKKKEVIHTNCMACGHAGTIGSAADRVAAYIIKNPPPKPQAAAAPTAAAAAAAPISSDIDHVPAKNDDDDDWGEDTNEDAVRKRMDELSAGAKSLMLNDDLEKSQEERLALFFEFLSKQASTIDLTSGENQKAIKAEADRLDISDKAVIVLCEILLKDNTIEKVKLYKNLFLRFTLENHKCQKYLLRGLELLITSMKDKLMPKVTMIFNTFYDLEIVVEDVFLDWYAKGQKRSNKLDENMREIYEKAKPFIQWLQDASEESDDEDENVDVDFDDRLVGDGIKVTEHENNKSPTKNHKTVNDETKAKMEANKTNSAKAATDQKTKPDEDEIDIDAI